jgi:hypothetical protein
MAVSADPERITAQVTQIYDLYRRVLLNQHDAADRLQGAKRRDRWLKIFIAVLATTGAAASWAAGPADGGQTAGALLSSVVAVLALAQTSFSCTAAVERYARRWAHAAGLAQEFEYIVHDLALERAVTPAIAARFARARAGFRDALRDEDPRPTAQRLAHSGYVAATIEYRLVPDGVFPAAAEDCFCALAFLRAHAQEYGLDPQRVALMGYSAGGQLVSLLGVHAEDPELQDPGCPAGLTFAPAAVIDGAGPADLRAMAGADLLLNRLQADLSKNNCSAR